MKKLSLLTSITMGVLLLFAAMAWAGEMSVFDDAQGLLIRAYTAPGTPSGTGLYLEVRDETGALLDTSKVSVTALTGTTLPTNMNKPTVPASSATTAEYTIHNTGLATTDVSLSYDTSLRTAFLFCTDSTTGLMVMKYNIASLLPIAGACGTPTGGPFASAPASGLCSVGNLKANTMAENTSTGQWTWVCQGLNNGADSSTCSALASVPGGCGTPGGPFSTAPTSGLCNPGRATTPVLNTGNASWTWDCQGLNTGSTATGCLASASIPGACGSANNGTFTSAPSGTSLCSVGTVVTAPSGTGPWSWVCAGPNSGANSPQCSASAQSSGPIDLDFTRYYGMLQNFSSSCSGVSNSPCAISMAIVNNGTGAAGNFKVKVWFSGSGLVDASASLVAEWDVAGLAGGATLSHTFNNVLYSGGAHVYYYFIIKIDADNQVTETNKTNNTYSWQVFMYR